MKAKAPARPRDSKGRFIAVRRNPAPRKTRRNVDAFTDSHGVVHPLSRSSDYSKRIVALRKNERERYSLDTFDQQLERRWPEYGDVQRKTRRLEEVKAELAALRETHDDSDLADLKAFIRKHGQEKGEINKIPFEQSRGLLHRLLGKEPEDFRTATVIVAGKRYLRWEYVLDELADNMGYHDAEELKRAIEGRAKSTGKAADLAAEIRKLEGELKATRKNPHRSKAAPKKARR